MIVDLPDPDGPTNAVVSPAFISISRLSKIRRSGLVGYLKLTYLKT
jgi:hypothetical protein